MGQKLKLNMQFQMANQMIKNYGNVQSHCRQCTMDTINACSGACKNEVKVWEQKSPFSKAHYETSECQGKES